MENRSAVVSAGCRRPLFPAVRAIAEEKRMRSCVATVQHLITVSASSQLQKLSPERHTCTLMHNHAHIHVDTGTDVRTHDSGSSCEAGPSHETP